MSAVRFFVGLPCLLCLAASSLDATADFTCAFRESDALSRQPAAKIAGRLLRSQPSHGQLNALVVYAQFDEGTQTTAPVPGHAARLFDPDLPGSFTHFYTTMSFSQLLVHGTVLPRRYQSPQPASAYLAEQASERGRYGQFVRDILQQVDAEVDLGAFDNDGPDGLPNSGDDDGMVDYLFLLMRSVPRDFIVGNADGVAGFGFTDVGYKFFTTDDPRSGGGVIRVAGTRAYGCILQEATFSQTVGGMAHEFGHALGLPDLYDVKYDSPEEDSAGIGRWGLMGWGAYGWHGDDGPNPLCAWSREQLGWIGRGNERLVEIEPNATGLPLEDLHAGGTVYRIPLPGAAPRDEYLLLETRTRDAHFYNRSMPADGLLLWRVRADVWDNNAEEYKLVDLVCADRATEAFASPSANSDVDDLDVWARDAQYSQRHAGNQGDSGDPFDGRRLAAFRLIRDDQVLTGQIRRLGEAMHLDLSVETPHTSSAEQHLATAVLSEPGSVPAESGLIGNYPNPFNAQTTIQYELPQPSSVELKIYSITGQVVRRLVEGRQAEGRYRVTWDGRDESGRPVASGLYLYHLETSRGSETLSMMLIR